MTIPAERRQLLICELEEMKRRSAETDLQSAELIREAAHTVACAERVKRRLLAR